MPFSKEEALKSIAGVHPPLAKLLDEQKHPPLTINEVNKYLRAEQNSLGRNNMAMSMAERLEEIGQKMRGMPEAEFKKHVVDAWCRMILDDEMDKEGKKKEAEMKEGPQLLLSHLHGELRKKGILR